MKPMIIIPPEVMTAEDINILRENGICVVVASDPAKVKFVDPIPAQSSRTEIESAAIKLSRKLLNWPWTTDTVLSRDFIAKCFVDLLVAGTPLDGRGTREEQEQQILDNAKRAELEKIGREEARAERAAKKAGNTK